MNNFTITGRLVRDLETRNTKIGMIGKGVVVENQWFDGKEQPQFYDFTCFDENTVNRMVKVCRKGTIVTLTGNMRYKDSTTNNGESRRYYDLLVDRFDVEFVGGKGGGDGGGSNYSSKPQKQEIDEEDIPL